MSYQIIAVLKQQLLEAFARDEWTGSDELVYRAYLQARGLS